MFAPANLFPVIALVFLLAAAWRWLRSGGRTDGAVRTWLLTAVIFGLVALWLRHVR